MGAQVATALHCTRVGYSVMARSARRCGPSANDARIGVLGRSRLAITTSHATWRSWGAGSRGDSREWAGFALVGLRSESCKVERVVQKQCGAVAPLRCVVDAGPGALLTIVDPYCIHQSVLLPVAVDNKTFVSTESRIFSARRDTSR